MRPTPQRAALFALLAAAWPGTRAQTPQCKPPCVQGHGTCSKVTGKPSCDCKENWSGPACAHATGCEGSPCGAHGTKCTATGGDHTCTCKAGWSGDQDCAHATGCEDKPCGAHGNCTATGGAHTCDCEDNYTGEKCDQAPKDSQVIEPWMIRIAAGAGGGVLALGLLVAWCRCQTKKRALKRDDDPFSDPADLNEGLMRGRGPGASSQHDPLSDSLRETTEW